jgi:hypothetical protein
MYFDPYVLFDKEHHINDDNQPKTKVMVRNRVDLLDYLQDKRTQHSYDQQKYIFINLVYQ